MAATDMLLPVSLSASFFDGAGASGIHAIQRAKDDESMEGATLRANQRTGRVSLHSIHGEHDGRIQAVNDLECVLILDEASQTYVLHHLASSTKLSAASGPAPTSTTPQGRVNGSATPGSGLAIPATNRISKTAHLSPSSNPNPPRSSPSPSPQPPPRHGLGIAGYAVGPASSPVLNGHAVADVEEFDADLASESEPDDDRATGQAGAGNDESDDDIDFDDGLALPPSQAAVPTPSMQPYHSPAVNPAMTSFFSNNAGIVSSDEEDDDEDEEDFADLANDLETSLEPNRNAQASSTGTGRQPAAPNGKSSTTAQIKRYDSDIASSSESDDD